MKKKVRLYLPSAVAIAFAVFLGCQTDDAPTGASAIEAPAFTPAPAPVSSPSPSPPTVQPEQGVYDADVSPDTTDEQWCATFTNGTDREQWATVAAYHDPDRNISTQTLFGYDQKKLGAGEERTICTDLPCGQWQADAVDWEGYPPSKDPRFGSNLLVGRIGTRSCGGPPPPPPPPGCDLEQLRKDANAECEGQFELFPETCSFECVECVDELVSEETVEGEWGECIEQQQSRLVTTTKIFVNSCTEERTVKVDVQREVRGCDPCEGVGATGKPLQHDAVLGRCFAIDVTPDNADWLITWGDGNESTTIHGDGSACNHYQAEGTYQAFLGVFEQYGTKCLERPFQITVECPEGRVGVGGRCLPFCEVFPNSEQCNPEFSCAEYRGLLCHATGIAQQVEHNFDGDNGIPEGHCQHLAEPHSPGQGPLDTLGACPVVD